MSNNPEQIVLSTFPGAGLVPLISGARFMGIAEKTARNWLVQKKFPVQTVTVGDKRFILETAVTHLKFVANPSRISI